MTAMQHVSLPDAFWFQEGPGLRNWQFTTSGIKVLNVGNILPEGTIDLSKTDRHISNDEFQNKYSHFSVDAGDLVIASSGISFDADGFLRTKIAFVEAEHLPLCMNTSTIRFKAKAGRSNLNYLRHWFQSSFFREQVSRLVTGSAQLNFGPSHLKQMTIALPPVEEQKRIAAILDQADALRRLRARALDRLNALGQAIFHEMFGDLRTNDRGWQISSVGECVLSVTNGMTRRSKPGEQETDVVLRLKDIRAGYITFEDLSRIALNSKERGRFSVKGGDLLFIRVNGNPDYVGRNAVFKGYSEPVFFNDHIMRVCLNDQKLDADFISFILNSDFGRAQIAVNRNTSAGQHTINQEGLSAITFPCPPLPKQMAFSQRLAALANIEKVFQQEALTANSLFTSLQHRAFRGEL